jgi:hypothetical protein
VARTTTTIRSQGNLFDQPNISLKNTQKCRKNKKKTLINVIGLIILI